jgi:hypothetical protein
MVPARVITFRFSQTPVLRYSEEPVFIADRPGSSAYLRTGV